MQRRLMVLMALLVGQVVWAQAPLKVGYQGRLLAADGTPKQGMVTVRFDFFDAATAGASLWSETQTLVLSDGLYSTFLGEVTPLSATLFEGGPRFLQVTVDGETLSPRQGVGSVPWALLARDPRLLSSCSEGEVLKWSTASGRWACARDEGVDSATLASTLNGYATTASLASYVTTTGLTTTLSGYATQGQLASYVTTASLSSSLSGYVTSSSLASTLSGYATTASIPTSVNGLTGGAISSGITVGGSVAAASFLQNGYSVCDSSGNCGATLPGSCAANQVMQWNGASWQCATLSSGTPMGSCTGTGRALQWDGSAWQCIDLRASSASGGQANGSELRDDWGDTWDAVPRGALSWVQASQACITRGGRLPTVTELWRNRVTHGSANLSAPSDTARLWSSAISHRTGYHLTVALHDGSRFEMTDATPHAFRCIWKATNPVGFVGARCFGPPGAECRSHDPFFNVDRWSRAPQYLASAQQECALENASVATAEDLEAGIWRGTNFVNAPDVGWPTWHWTSSSGYFGNGYSYPSVLRWTNAQELAWWPDGNTSNSTYSNLYSFRCIGKKSPTSGTPPPAPSCQGTCFQQTVRSRLIADGADRAAATWLAATTTCAALGGSLPGAEQFHQLVTAGWPNGSGAHLWSSSAGPWGWQGFRWTGAGTPYWNHLYDVNYTSTILAVTATAPYRCVWRETEAASFVTCPVGQVQLRDAMTGVSSCVVSTLGDAAGQQNPSNLPPFVDAWGNAFDLLQRAPATFSAATAACESRGGRLPLATELFRVRYAQGVVPTELGQSGTATIDPLWTLTPEHRPNFQLQVRLSDGAVTAASTGATTAPYRCVWPATRPTAFSGHACYGDPAAPCFTVGRLRADAFPRARVPHASAQFECRFLGGRLPTVAEAATLQQAAVPNSAAGVWEWTRDWQYWNNGATYVLMTARGNNPTRANWTFSQSLSEANMDASASPQRFRCVFSDLME